MIQVIYGEKGTGKTKRILDLANDTAKTTKGSVVFLDDDNNYMYDLVNAIRFINATEYGISGPKEFSGFVLGLAAQDFDLEYLFADGFLRIVKHPLASLEEMFSTLKTFSDSRNITIVLSVSGAPDEIPDFVKPYII